MSFSFNFKTKPADVAAELESNLSAKNAPECVKEFIRQAVVGLPTEVVAVNAYGHLFSNDYQISTCNIEVKPVTDA